MRVRLFGGVGAIDADGAALDVGPAKCQVVLATLALSVGSSVPVRRLVDAVWGQDPPRTAERTLQSYIAGLRKVLGAATIARSAGTYRLDLPRDAVDVARFERCLDLGDVEGALREWTGPPLAGLAAPGLDSAVVALTERWLAAVERDLERRVEDDPAGCIGRLTELTAAHPFREGLWALLMTALYRVGRQADALAAYRTAHDQLADHLGVEPGPRLNELQVQVLRHDDQLASRPASATPPAAARPTGTVTFAFAELEGTAVLWSAHRLAMTEVTTRHHELVLQLARRHDGHLFSRGGDSFGLAFSRADRAACWAGDLQDAVRSQAWPDKLEIAVRVGLHTGEADEHEGGYFGPAVNTAARLAAVGHGGQTLVSAATASLLDGHDTRVLRDLGWHALDGVVAEQRILQLGDDEYPPLRSQDRHRGNLPRRVGPLIGRDEELDRIGEALLRHSVVTLVGPGGIGKTRLSLAAARRAGSGDDSWLIELAEIDAGTDVARAVAEVLSVAERQGVPLIQGIVETLRARRALLVLDNCEHVVEAAAHLAESVVQGCPDVRIVATSRERLGLTGERIITVPPLEPTGAGVELFVDRAKSVSSAYDAITDVAAVEEICSRLDGIPLAIELAAARTASLSPADLLERLRHRLHVLDGTRRSGADRHRTLWSAIRWSYDLLSPGERTVFERVSVFVGGFDLAAAEWVAAEAQQDAVEVTNALGRLAEQSLIVVSSGPFGRSFRLLEPIRQFARERLEEAGSSERVAERHAAWCLCEVTGIHGLLAGSGEIEGVARLAELWANLRSAVDWACETDRRVLARDLMTPILSEIVVRSSNEIGDWAERLLAITPPDDEEGLVFGLYAAAHRYSMTQDPDSYERLVWRFGEPEHVLTHHGRAIVTEDYELMARWAPRAVEEFRARGDDHLAERAEINVATAWMNLGQLERSDARLAELVTRYRDQGPATFLNWTLLLLGYSAMFQGDPERADAYFDEGIAIELPPRTHTPSQPLRARAAFRRGDHDRAYRLLHAHLDELLLTDNMQAGMMDCVEFVTMMTSTGHLAEAARVLGHLESSHLLDGPGWRALVADAAETISQTPGVEPGPALPDDRSTLEFIREVLGQIIAG